MNEVKEANHVSSVELVEKPATRIKRPYRRRKVQEIVKQNPEPRAFVEVSSQPPKSVRVRRSR